MALHAEELEARTLPAAVSTTGSERRTSPRHGPLAASVALLHGPSDSSSATFANSLPRSMPTCRRCSCGAWAVALAASASAWRVAHPLTLLALRTIPCYGSLDASIAGHAALAAPVTARHRRLMMSTLNMVLHYSLQRS